MLSLLVLTAFHFTGGANDKETTTTTTNMDQDLDTDLKKGPNEKACVGQFKRFFQLSIICSTICIQLISFGLIMNNNDEYTPLVLFSWWRNKIS